jgi:hypothetical protein
VKLDFTNKKISMKWIRLACKTESMKQQLLDKTSKACEMKVKIDQWDDIKQKRCAAKERIKSKEMT